MAQRRRNIGDFTARTETNATGADQAAKREIERAWTHVEEASSKLDAAGEDGWEDATLTSKHRGIWRRRGPRSIRRRIEPKAQRDL